MVGYSKTSDYQAVAASQTDAVLAGQAGAGAKGDILETLIVTVNTAATSTVSIKDGGGSSISIVPANTPVGVYAIQIGARSQSGAWKVTTGAGAQVVAVGRFK